MRALLMMLALLAGCGEVWNDPYPAAERGQNILYSVFPEVPKHLDPAQSYASDEALFTRQVYEPPLQYHYLKRPYELIPLTATEIPRPRFVEKGGATYSVYDIHIKPGIRYQPHPAFVAGNLSLDRKNIAGLKSPYDLPLGTRELTADDYIYEIKRLAHPQFNSPVFGLMSEYIVGLKEYSERLKAASKPGAWLDLRAYDLEGVTRLDEHSYRVTLKGRYPQFVYWLAMPFFAPMPWEADKFFHQPGMAEKNFTLDWWPVGTGAFMLSENDPNARMVLARNPNFRGEPYPSEGEPGDAARGLLADAGKRMPFLDKAVYTREKEAIPLWNKFLQGYYDLSGIGSENFDQAVRVSLGGEAGLSPEMEAKGIRLDTTIAPSIFYLGVNWLDPVVGGSRGGAAAERARKLRQALAIAVDWEEYLSIFANGRGVPSQSPLAPGIFGFREGAGSINPVTHVWKDGKAHRRPIETAKKLLAEAGYPDGRDAKTGQPLVLYLDTTQRGPGDKSVIDWWRKQFAKLSVQFEPRQTDWNRFQEKLRKGSTQLFIVGWSADYPDPENFMFLLHGPQSRAKYGGENASNYANPEFDALFERMRNMPNGPERQQIIDRMTEIFRHDAPWLGGYHPKNFALFHSWLGNAKVNEISDNKLKYLKVDPVRREALRREWNRPVFWPVLLVFLALALSIVPALRLYRRRERMAARPAA
ncbi:MAG TPA: ABC transporter substrate-binding protein [Burkholderiales bacterium]|nr:ABC transporter substrate-binding protein [Burkholderiales bacterium]